jgi:uncharacterized protein (TIGR03067 family)
MRTCAVIRLLLVPLLGFAPAPKPKDDPKSELKKLQGSWRLVAFERDGVPRPVAASEPLRVVVSDQWSLRRDGELLNPRTLRLDPKKRPRQFELHMGGAQVTIEGIYALDGDTLKLCYTFGPRGHGRPKEFRTVPGRGQSMQTFKREKR